MRLLRASVLGLALLGGERIAIGGRRHQRQPARAGEHERRQAPLDELPGRDVVDELPAPTYGEQALAEQAILRRDPTAAVGP